MWRYLQRNFRVASLALVGAVMAVSAQPAQAQACGDPVGRAVSAELQRQVDANRPAFERSIMEQLGRPNLIGSGRTLYNMNFALGTPNFEFQNGQVAWTLNNNYLYTKITTPSVLGAYADPAFEVRFDSRLDGSVVMGADGRPQAQNMVARVTRITVSPRNVTGGIVTTVDRFFQLAGQGGLILNDSINQHLSRDVTAQVNRALAQVNFPRMQQSPGGLMRTFTNPTYSCGLEIVRADACARWGNDCGPAGALAFCRAQGFRSVASSTPLPSAGRTYVLADRRICAGPGCASFSSITCTNVGSDIIPERRRVIVP